MQLVKTLALGLLATVLWNCNGSTQPDAAASADPEIPATIKTMAKVAAIGAGQASLGQSLAAADGDIEFDLPTDALQKMAEAGICQGFIDLVAELSTTEQSVEAGFSPRLQEVVMCFIEKVELDSAAIRTNLQGIVEDCFCKGTGNLGDGFAAAFSAYAKPNVGSTYAPPQSGSTYSEPSIGGSVYKAPTGATADVYSAPSL